MSALLKIGVDIGSTTIKMVVIDQEGNLIYKTYKRHLAEIRTAFTSCLEQAKEIIGGHALSLCIAGSGGMSLAEELKIPFIQEVIASTKAIQMKHPETDVVIELGGEDAKITYLQGGLEQRMNGTCAGGTGAFIDQMATLLHTDASGLNTLAKAYGHIYPIAARCGVFAKTDIQPLMNEGAKQADIAMSIFHAVVVQTISVLACGRPIRGKVAFLGGPLTFLSELRKRFIEVLELSDEAVIFPEHSELYVAWGAALACEEKGVKTYEALLKELRREGQNQDKKYQTLPPLFEKEADYLAFKARHGKSQVKEGKLEEASGRCFLGIDAGSTTTKATLINEAGEILYSYYASNKGNPIEATRVILKEIYTQLPSRAQIAYSCVTGYGEALLKEAFSIDLGEIETVAHYKGAKFFCPEVDFILDIGGQDMKCLHIKEGAIQSITLNEACSAGCGSFLQAFANSLGLDIQSFAKKSLFAKHPVDLGSKCTVFMNSKVKQAQKEGFSVEDISAGLAYSVVKNSLYKVIKLKNPEALGKHIVVEGGTFYNEGVLRSFEKLIGKEVIRPNISGLMGAFGAALLAKERFKEGQSTTLVELKELETIKANSKTARCGRCSNNCLLTLNSFPNNKRFISGNRCEAPLGNDSKESELPDLYEYKYKRVFKYIPLSPKQAKRGVIGIPRVLNMYENYPFWFTLFTYLGFRVELSSPSSKKVYEKGVESIVSETACYPAKMVHGHIEDLIERGVKQIFYPCIVHEAKEFEQADNCFNCPVVTSYPEVIANNMEHLEEEKVQLIHPFLPMTDKKKLKKRLYEEFKVFHISKAEIHEGIEAATKEQESFKEAMRQKGEETLRFLNEKGIRGVLLGGRPYHIDPEINHGIPKLINSLGFAVLTEDAIAHLGNKEIALRVVNQWAYHSRLYAAANQVVEEPLIELVQLTSFGCGIDAITVEQVQEILESKGKLSTVIKIDEGSHLGAARIRLRSLKASIEEREQRQMVKKKQEKVQKVSVKRESKKGTIIVPEFSPTHFEVLAGMLHHYGYQVEVLRNNEQPLKEGLQYLNNDMCYPAMVVIGQIMEALKSGKYDLNTTSVLLAQTEGQCRFTNYLNLLQKSLQDAGMEEVQVLSLSLAGIKKENTLEGLTIEIMKNAVIGMIYGDLLTKVLYRVRPYEKITGSANKLYEEWLVKCKASFAKMNKETFRQIIHHIIEDFEKLPRKNISKPKVGIVGESLVKLNPIANNHIVEVLEKEGVEVVANDLLSLLLAPGINQQYRYKKLNGSFGENLKGKITIRFIESYQKIYTEALKKSKLFYASEKISELARHASQIIDLGHQSGEGWKLSGEIMELVKWDVKNIICMQPFGCLPAHANTRGVLKKIKKLHQGVNVVTIEYDPDSSEVNQMNRIKLMLASAFNKI
ncbi:2-hydroxyglutaryl-CoA dehydratase [Sporanaerobium hydrogeniformans]|uniref:2-hydroxyglutaryl-CoA dehydratase n=1 Tax=Sporanaerobium hydrogeniformans TaxID=3072179 RepID=A0AC61DKN1_9FIRM|nr:acyl-CoA dehydratase activase-related protein [Sporanaerobium hydrogeniformans]PHV72227.1 2-hydroxyglutaryl-CoA dehydratase [Sporanaerobium hydrogeniformans]